MKVFINPGHDLDYDSGAVNPNSGLRECDVAAKVGNRVKSYLEAAGCEVQLLQSDNLYFDSQYNDRPVAVCAAANDWPADVFVSLHCNAANTQAQGTEVECYGSNSAGGRLAQCIQSQIVNSIGTVDRGVKEMPGLIVLKYTDMPACLVEMAFIDNDADAQLLVDQEDDFARAIARGITDYQCTL
ncbi:cell wall hydrolase [Megasphaera cerevisiae DSM 20462]|jgi:N-acetylmuramoyl-L-alanine amidase|uniref:Cell wall hydrolase n=1 Tax=Megasphaera cerevisiae DSM 20462 TaxID=1122219 RepID=A0A0J6WWA2_9FIRM|nr:N-acetylmuramoyl-L-alanine amidase [Megasphaera cerevisiae]KMO86869.1 cell wall hydrolase [Megasphaera cerevisiae DSM 20462]SJZ83719.1 N-acetylmuramoyl-L-alanine amidase [Megasphaera cerevisiae DSM 20462]